MTLEMAIMEQQAKEPAPTEKPKSRKLPDSKRILTPLYFFIIQSLFLILNHSHIIKLSHFLADLIF